MVPVKFHLFTFAAVLALRAIAGPGDEVSSAPRISVILGQPEWITNIRDERLARAKAWVTNHSAHSFWCLSYGTNHLWYDYEWRQNREEAWKRERIGNDGTGVRLIELRPGSAVWFSIGLTGQAGREVRVLLRLYAKVKDYEGQQWLPLLLDPVEFVSNSVRVEGDPADPVRKGASEAGNAVPIPLKLPAPAYFSRVVDKTVPDPHVEPRSTSARPPFLAPVGVTNLAFQKAVTASDTDLTPSTLSKITDGEKEPADGNVVQMHTGKQWVQVDLEGSREVYAIVIWHRETEHPIFQCVVVQTADDAAMTMNVHTLFNNDYANLLGLGAGADKQYVESNEGRLIDAKGIKGRYVRCYSKGSNQDRINYYTEIEVWGLPGR